MTWDAMECAASDRHFTIISKWCSSQIEAQLERAIAIGNRRGRESIGRDIQRHLPAVIQPGARAESDLADDLRP